MLTKTKYGAQWRTSFSDVQIEISCIRKGGTWNTRRGTIAGKGLYHHYKTGISLMWPHLKWHKWNELSLKCFLEYRVIGEMGPASSGKTHDWSIMVLFDYYCFPENTTVLVSSTTRESLEMRAWGEIKAHHKIAKRQNPWLPGYLIEGKQRIVSESKDEAAEGRDFRNGIVGVPCKKGENWQGLQEYVGIKNDRVRLLADELPFMPPSFVDSIANLNKNPDFKCGGLGNPKDIMDAHGLLCAPSDQLGGWDCGIDQTPITKTWATRFDRGVCIQRPGSDSPNYDGLLGIPLISKKDIDADVAFYGKDSLQYTMMDEGRMPRGQGNKRILTRNFCLRHQAGEEPMWSNAQRTKIGFCDAAFRGVGGDRCVFGWLEFGYEAESLDPKALVQAVIDQSRPRVNQKQIIALMDTMVIPIVQDTKVDPEDQIVLFIREHCEALGILPNNVFYDSTGRGTLASAFGRLWDVNVGAIEFGGKPSDRPVAFNMEMTCQQYFDRMVSELWFMVRMVVEANQFRGMTEEVMREGCMREWGMLNGKTWVEPKDKMKIKTGRSPDLFDALVSGVEGARRRGFMVNNEAVFKPRQREDSSWKRDLRDRAKQLVVSKSLSFN